MVKMMDNSTYNCSIWRKGGVRSFYLLYWVSFEFKRNKKTGIHLIPEAQNKVWLYRGKPECLNLKKKKCFVILNVIKKSKQLPWYTMFL